MRLTGLIAILISLFSHSQLLAQPAGNDPTKWTYSVKPVSGGYELVFELKLDEGWHIWSLSPGGDGFQLVPVFTFNEAAGVKTEGPVKESGTVISKEMEGIEGKVNYYSHKVVYTQKVKAKPGTVITGTHEYQVCTDAMCLPPMDKEFSFTIQ